MKYAKTLGLGLLIVALAAMGCSGTGPTPPKADDKKGENEKEHAHGDGPHDGVTFDLGKYHAELVVSHPKKEIYVYFLKEVKGKKEKDWPPEAVAAKELTLTTKETKTKEGKVVPPMTITLRPEGASDGKASKFVGTDPGLGNVADFEGTVLGEIDGKPSQGTFKEE